MADPWASILCTSLAVLALSPERQIEVNGPGCLACDLLNDFDHARTYAIEVGKLNGRQRAILDSIDKRMDDMGESDFVCWDNSVVNRPIWQDLRDLALLALSDFGWENVIVPPATQSEPGIWLQPPADS